MGSIPGSGSLLGAADGRHFSARGWTGLGLRHLLLNAKQLPNLFLSITELYSAKTHALRHKCRSRAARVRGLPAPRPSSSPTASGSRVWPKVKTGVPWGGRGAGPAAALATPQQATVELGALLCVVKQGTCIFPLLRPTGSRI